MASYIKVGGKYSLIDAVFAAFTYTENVQVGNYKRNIITYYQSFSDPESRDLWVPGFMTEADKNALLADPRFHKMSSNKYVNFNILPSFIVTEANNKVTKLEEFSIKDQSGLGSIQNHTDISALIDAINTLPYLKIVADSGYTYLINTNDIYSVDTDNTPGVAINISARETFKSNTKPILVTTQTEIDKVTDFILNGTLPTLTLGKP